MPGTSEEPQSKIQLRPPVLSLSRPWPWLIFRGGKPVENRKWATTYRGDVLIHASGSWDGRAIPFAGGLTAKGVPGIPLHELSGNHDLHPNKAVVGVVELYDICTGGRGGDPCDCPPWASPGQNHWKIRNTAEFPRPVPCRGNLSLWQLTDEVWPAVETQLKEVGRV